MVRLAHVIAMSVLGAGLLEGARVLVVDDDDDSRDVVAITLEHLGASVITASNAAGALRALQTERPQVILSDLGLPGEDGLSLLRKVRALPESKGGAIPAIALTGRSRSQDRAEIQEGGFQLHLIKPVTPEALVEAILHVLRNVSSS